MPTTWKNKMIEESFNYPDSTIKDMTDFFGTREEILKPKEEKKNSSAEKRLQLQCRRVQ